MKKNSPLIMSQQGVSAVEFALVLPFLLVLLFGIIEFGIFLFDKAVITNASREGARTGIVHVHESQVSDPEIKAVVKNYAETYLINLGSPGVGPDLDNNIDIDRTGGDLTVTVNFTYDFLVFPDLTDLLGDNFFDGSIDLVGRTIMRLEDQGGTGNE